MIPQSYNFNMYGNNLAGMLQTGMNMFNSMGNANFFTNCFGEVNYDKMAGFQVANALLGVGMQAIEAHQSQKEPEVNYTQELNTVAKDLSAKEDELTDLNTDKTKLVNANEELKIEMSAGNQNKTLTSLQSELDSANKKVGDLTGQLNKLTSEDPSYSKIESDLKQAKKDAETLQKDVDLKKKIEENNGKIEDIQKEIDEKEDEINDLESKQKRLQESADAKAIKEYKSCSWQRADADSVSRWQKSDTGNIATKKELNRAIYEYKHAKTTIEKENARNAIINMYDSNSEEFKSKYYSVYQAVKNNK